MARCQWQPAIHDLFGYRCPRDAGWFGSLCILHDPSPSKDQLRFREAVQSKIHSGDYDFRGVTFIGEFTLTGSVKNADFSWAIFPDKAKFRSIQFEAASSFCSARFAKAAIFVDATFQGDADFRGVVFEEKASFVHIVHSASAFFNATVFKGEAVFEKLEFAGPVSFNSSEFHLQASFENVRFSDDVEFSHARFLSNVYFGSASFRGESRFALTKFKGRADFTMADFGGKTARRTYFLRATFSQDVSFEWSQFLGGVFFTQSTFYGPCHFGVWTFISSGQTFGTAGDFKNVRFEGAAYFEDLGIYGYMKFDHAEFARSAFFRGPFHPALLPGQEIPADARAFYENLENQYYLSVLNTAPLLEFTNVLLERANDVHFEKLHLGLTSFKGTNLRRVTFYDVEWPRAMGRECLIEPDSAPAGHAGIELRSLAAPTLWQQFLISLSRQTVADEFGFGRVVKDEENARQECRDLKANLEDQKDYADAGDFYFSEMELRRRALLSRGPSGWLPWLLHSLYWLTSGYGERIFRSSMAFLILWLALAGLFTMSWFKSSEPVKWRLHEYEMKSEFRPSYSESVSYAFRSLTFQKGTYMVPFTPWAERLTLLANVLGPAQLGFLFLAVRRRFWR